MTLGTKASPSTGGACLIALVRSSGYSHSHTEVIEANGLCLSARRPGKAGRFLYRTRSAIVPGHILRYYDTAWRRRQTLLRRKRLKANEHMYAGGHWGYRPRTDLEGRGHIHSRSSHPESIARLNVDSTEKLTERLPKRKRRRFIPNHGPPQTISGSES
ncbi:hypothetical protein BGZ61DRAFT_472191 [Ilyonectria robusta]|uniref:uncharacterized protein n=1 Tax=Ilyonectria robusta TaxID=1079257 RepID=UPI001E8ECDC0|nr:uncharacterized protein BGZ61DRAFT_472191 [Ilyonectria robusta]KAH8735800.1 hypothetical protein BGZ61DRAFT_472191 [Ilyonectria robusta]